MEPEALARDGLFFRRFCPAAFGIGGLKIENHKMKNEN
jgi:hypothetical protein